MPIRSGNFCICLVAIGIIVEVIVFHPIHHRTYTYVIGNLLVLLIGGILIAMPIIFSITMDVGFCRFFQQDDITKRVTASEEMVGMEALSSDKIGLLSMQGWCTTMEVPHTVEPKPGPMLNGFYKPPLPSKLYPLFTIAVKSQHISFEFQIPPACEILQMSANLCSNFGLLVESADNGKGEAFHDEVGSPYYVALEILKRHYGPEAGVWGAGVILYILLSGVPHFWVETKTLFWAETETTFCRQVLQGTLDFGPAPWPSISGSAEDLMRRMLERDPTKRISAHEVLCHPWIIDDTVAPDKPLDSAILIEGEESMFAAILEDPLNFKGKVVNVCTTAINFVDKGLLRGRGVLVTASIHGKNINIFQIMMSSSHNGSFTQQISRITFRVQPKMKISGLLIAED